MANSAASGPAVPVAQRPLTELLDAVAARTPAPGGGAVAGVTCALAAALVQMTAAFGSGSEADSVGARAGQLRVAALRLADEDLDAYAPVLEALALPRDAPDRRQRLADARGAAAEPPLGIAEAAAEVAELGVTAARSGSPHLIGDAVTGVVLAEAASRAAAELVAINLGFDGDDPRRPRAGQQVRRASAARQEIFAIRED